MADYSKEFTCTPRNDCVACAPDELSLAYCTANGYKQEVACEWNGGVPKEYQDAHRLPEYLACDSLADLERRGFLHNMVIFIVVGLLAFALYGWRRKRLMAGQYRSV
ncbi:hypothetical protein LPJ53_005576 [Coemansia erecta]|uniref:Uncharacterized protein n=1 Tax=Coemansia erecta TaxID=147472 RepID=A0A9W7XX91_9FUNG|nr:hypothetical protein LPJ53_005576 [Coemansia erecta]